MRWRCSIRPRSCRWCCASWASSASARAPCSPAWSASTAPPSLPDARRALAGLNGRLLRAYSRRCAAALPVRLGPLEALLAANVDKEVRKDGLVIRAASPDLEVLLQEAREIDRDFVARLERFPLVSLRIRYEDVEPIRRRRMQLLLEAAAALARAPWRGIRPAARACYSRAEFETLLREHLRLYAAEVHALSRSVRPALAVAPVRERLRELMERRADSLAQDVAGLLYASAIR